MQAPAFEVDPMWPKPMPNHWILGSAIGVWVDKQDHVWIIHRGASTLDPNENALGGRLSKNCCTAAPPVLEFDQEGNLVQSWGGPGQGYEWPDSNHGIFVETNGTVWIAGNGAHDGQLLKFTRDGKFIKQIGFGWANAGSTDMFAFRQPAKVFVDEPNKEAYVADGYGNHRVVVLDSETGEFKRLWGAYGNKPDDKELRPLPTERRAAAAVPKSGALRGYLGRSARLRLRPRQRPAPGVHAGREIREGTVLREGHARIRLGVGHRLLEGPAAEVSLHGRRHEPAHLGESTASRCR